MKVMIQFMAKVMMAEEMSRRLGYTITYLSPRLATLKEDWEIIEESNMSSSYIFIDKKMVEQNCQPLV